MVILIACSEGEVQDSFRERQLDDKRLSFGRAQFKASAVDEKLNTSGSTQAK